MAATTLHGHNDTQILREVIVQHTFQSIGKTKEELYRDVVDDFGECGVRRFYRSLAYLIRVGCVRRDDECEWDLDTGVFRPVYFRVNCELPPQPVWWCRVCFVITGRKIHRSFCKTGRGAFSPLRFESGTHAAAPSSSRTGRQASARQSRRAA